VLDPGNHVITVASAGGGNDLNIVAAISQTSTAAGIQKEGPGRMTLATANSYTGTTTVNAGTLQVDGAQSQSTVQINGGTLQGIGSVGPIFATSASATIAPGDSPGILTCGSFDASGGSGVLRVELNGTTPGSGYDQLNVVGSVNLNGVTLNASLNFPSATNDQFAIINNDDGVIPLNFADPITGTFTGLPQGKKLYIGKELFQISYTGGTGNDVVLSRLVTPPPPSLTIQKIAPVSVRLLWPTNDPPFSLQSTTNLQGSNWTAVFPLPVGLGTNNIVTNSITSSQLFYRLSNP